MGSVSDREPWQVIAQRKQAERGRKIPAEWRLPTSLLPTQDVEDVFNFPQTSGFFTPRELELTGVDASKVVARIAAGEWTSEEVTRAICKRAAVAQQLVNCLTEICFNEAIARAKELDRRLKEDGRVVGPLHGLPISLKDQFNIPGLDSTLGYVSRVGQPAASPSTLVQILHDAGAVVYVKTNVPATLMMGETVNNVFGRSLNPHNRTLTPGGSSGGESALISLGGSYLGVGTDGGSIRHPCSFTGLYGLRPSQGRVSYQNVQNTFVGQEAVRSSAGPMCRSPDDIRLFMSSILAEKPWRLDPYCLPIAWREEEEVLPHQLCFGIASHDGFVSATPPLVRAIEIVKQKLLDAGHRVIEYIPHEMQQSRVLITKMWAADGGEEFQRDTDLSGEPLHPDLEAWLGHSANAPKPSVSDMWRVQNQRTMLAQKWSERWENTQSQSGTGRPIDGLIMPSLPSPAVKHDSSYPSHYGTLSPLLDLTTGSFPVTRVDLEKDVLPTDRPLLSERDGLVKDFYGGPTNHKNAPVGLAVIGRRLEEEKVTAMLKILSKIVGDDAKGA
ncbi:hypothetical protein PRZ48_009322 [Zasmidium cellare]|uniref:Amidase domain-containing protein n=1 Tax=Zasmidium cellare TaxID=395010 RepID=A0ABR0EBF0_ZASCE|nr:hypothetical protein PRZ48_009322 [Zasmidium cellare]